MFSPYRPLSALFLTYLTADSCQLDSDVNRGDTDMSGPADAVICVSRRAQRKTCARAEPPGTLSIVTRRWHGDGCRPYRVEPEYLALARDLLSETALIELSPHALEPFSKGVRTLDALHLASLHYLHSERAQKISLATYDDRRRQPPRPWASTFTIGSPRGLAPHTWNSTWGRAERAPNRDGRHFVRPGLCRPSWTYSSSEARASPTWRSVLVTCPSAGAPWPLAHRGASRRKGNSRVARSPAEALTLPSSESKAAHITWWSRALERRRRLLRSGYASSQSARNTGGSSSPGVVVITMRSSQAVEGRTRKRSVRRGARRHSLLQARRLG
jgi:hypothetical protein